MTGRERCPAQLAGNQAVLVLGRSERIGNPSLERAEIHQQPDDLIVGGSSRKSLD